MRIYKQIPALLLVALVLSGCVSASITNLTSGQLPRNKTGLYQVEAAFNSEQQTLLWNTIKPKVVVGTDFFAMQPTPLMKNRWEGLIPVPEGTNVVYYSFKFDFDYSTFGLPRPDSRNSATYRLEIKDQ